MFICPEKQYYAYEILNNHTFKKGNFQNSNKNFLFLFILIFSNNLFLIFKANNFYNLNIFKIITLFFILIVFVNELKLFFSSLSFLTDINLNYEQINEISFFQIKNNKKIYSHPDTLKNSKDLIEYQPKLYLISTINIIKFFHILFIIFFFILNTFKYIKDKKTSYTNQALNLHNFLILLFFYFLS